MKSKVFGKIYEYFILTLGCAIFAVSWECFMIPNGMSAGGLMGLCTVVQFVTNGLIPASVSYVVVNVFLIALSILLFGIGFGFKTIYCIAVSTVMMELASRMPVLFCLPGQFFYVPEKILIPIIAGVLEAVGIGLILRKGGSTGGTDILALMVNKYWPVAISRFFLVSDILVICSLLLVPGKVFGDMVYGFEMIVTFSLMIEVVIGGQKSTMQIMVFSERFREIADYVKDVMGRGATIIHAQGWYTKEEKDILLIIVRRNELPMVTDAVKHSDPRAFMSVSPASFVYGEGFEEIKAGIKNPLKKDKNG